MRKAKSPYVTLALSALGVAFASTALAQSNTLTIEQRGSENQLTVDQSRASGSTVGGLSLLPQPLSRLAPVFAPRGADRSALQIGNGNMADIEVEGVGGNVVLLQNSGRGGGNDATISMNGDNLASVIQSGAGNTATVNITGELSAGAVTQVGDGNTGSVSVVGQRTTGLVSQVGSSNTAGLTVIGNDVSASYTQLGSGLQAFDTGSLPAGVDIAGAAAQNGGVVVMTNAQNVSITQIGFGTGN